MHREQFTREQGDDSIQDEGIKLWRFDIAEHLNLYLPQ
jgi:hypothetical protein